LQSIGKRAPLKVTSDLKLNDHIFIVKFFDGSSLKKKLYFWDLFIIG
jgi:hypothetical protein